MIRVVLDTNAVVSAQLKPAGLEAAVLLLAFCPTYNHRTTPAKGLLADAYNFFGILPARNACRPACTAKFIAVAISTASSASAIAVFINTPS